MVAGLQDLMGNDKEGNPLFVFGSFTHQPAQLPYGNYAEIGCGYYRGDDRVQVRVFEYIVRIVTELKDFDLELQVEDLFESLNIPFEKVTSEELYKQHVYCGEWIVRVIEIE